ncbi:CobW family GTP-binding protein [uncultured Paracoccus sp.]|uniref:CobW family GTP-binding protein n=1 Tax=uncultured Paracoccus sp. TaxID=189685 RepID=UPI0026261360|nr:CobW family GTP-binding protein [uncultured Paracoccus sp.]
MSRVPLLVVGGFLGAGKTSLVTHLLQQSGGRRLLVLVNDFGAVNIDAGLIAEAGGDSIALTNGCVCCAMTGDLYYAVGDALDRNPRPDAIVIEASGISDPARIAALALAEPDLSLAGTVTVVNAEEIGALLDDPQIGAQIAQQIAAADLLVLTRTEHGPTEAAGERLAAITPAPQLAAPFGRIDPDLLFGLDPAAPNAPATPAHHHHADHFAKWTGDSPAPLPADRIRALLENPPAGLYRLKGWITDETGTREVHRVGRHLQLSPAAARSGSQLVAIGPSGRFRPEDMAALWREATAG